MRQQAYDDVVNVEMRHPVRPAVVLEGGDHPALRLARREPGQARGLQQAERLDVG